MPGLLKQLRLVGYALGLGLSLAAVGCRAQTMPGAQSGVGTRLTPELARRVEVMIRSRSSVPPEYVIAIGPRTKSDVAGFDQISVTFSASGNTSKPLNFLLSADGKTLAQFNKYDLSADPREKVSAAGRPARGGGENAPVLIVGYDDLECPFCAKMHAALFPALLERYGDRIRIVYRDFPLDQHPWAIHAAVDANCLAAASPAGYWNYVDYVHAHAAEFGGEEHSVAKATASLDKLAEDEGQRNQVSATVLAACVQKQDDSRVKASQKEGEALGVEATPALFINGERIDGAIPMEYVYRIVDEALVAAGQTPPPAPPAAAPLPAPAAPTKPGI